jgi:branched-chain amino acid transport system ATP-binding protein
VTSALLEVDALVAGYEPDAPVVRGASVTLHGGELVAVLGPNGAGKSTFIKALAGLVPVTSGRIVLSGEDFRSVPAHERARRGLAYVPQIDNVFATLSIEDNLALAAQLLPRGGRRSRIEAAYELFPVLADRRGQDAGRLSGGQRQMLAVARALVTEPRVLLLDEPSAGLSPKMVGELFARLRGILGTGVTILLVEQNVRAAIDISDRVCVLVEGRNRLEGRAADLAGDPAIAALYLGKTPIAASAAPSS